MLFVYVVTSKIVLPSQQESNNSANMKSGKKIFCDCGNSLAPKSTRCYSCQGVARKLYRFNKLKAEDYRQKERCRGVTRYKIYTGELKRLPCEVCGSVKSDAHHKDYSDPVNVVWLCRKHHLALHAEQERKIKPPKPPKILTRKRPTSFPKRKRKLVTITALIGLQPDEVFFDKNGQFTETMVAI